MKKLRKTIKLCILRGTQGVRPPAAEGSLLPAGIRGAGIFECIVVYCCVCVHVFSCVYISTSLYFYAYLHMYSHSAVICVLYCVYLPAGIMGATVFDIWAYCCVYVCICVCTLQKVVCLKYIYKVAGVFLYVLSVNQSDCVYRFIRFLWLCFIFYVPARFSIVQ